jgi:hypothetical protein
VALPALAHPERSVSGRAARASPALFPRLGPLPPRWGWIVALAAAVAWLVCLPASADPTHLLLGGPPDLPGLVHVVVTMADVGPAGWSHSRMLMFPSISNFYAQKNFPGEGLLGAPFVALLGWPAGFTVFSVASVAAFGASTGLFVARWWRSLAAGLVGVVAAETSAVVVREIGEGRLTHVLGLVFAPIAVALYVRGVLEDRGRWSFAAGLALGASALVFWSVALWVGLLLAVVFVAGASERLPVVRHALWVVAGTVALAGAPLLYTVHDAGAHPGSQYGPWSLVEEIPGKQIPLVQLLEGRDLFHFGWRTVAWRLRPLLLACCLLPLWKGRARRVAVPLGWIALAALFAGGPLWHLGGLDLLTPALLQTYVPVLRRYWWPDRYLLMATLGVAVLAGGAAARAVAAVARPVPRALATGGLCLALLAETWLVLPTLPMPATRDVPDEDVAVLARGEGPTVVIPPWDLDPDAQKRTWSLDARLGQIRHRRPLLVGEMNPDAVVAGAFYRDFWATGVLASLRGCEKAFTDPVVPDPDPAASMARLHRAGVRQIYDDPRLEGPPAIAAAWRACVVSVLGVPSGEEGPYLVFTVPPPAEPPAEAPAEPPAGP